MCDAASTGVGFWLVGFGVQSLRRVVSAVRVSMVVESVEVHASKLRAHMVRKHEHCEDRDPGAESKNYLPLVSREWRNGVQLYLLLLPFLHSLLTKNKIRGIWLESGSNQGARKRIHSPRLLALRCFLNCRRRRSSSA